MRTAYLQLKVFLIFTVFLLLFSAWKNTSAHTIQWLPPFEKKITTQETFRSLNFTGASFDENFLPLFILTEPLSSFTSEIRTTLRNVITEPLIDEDLIRNPQWIGSDFNVTSRVVTQKKKPYASISVLPIRKNVSGSFERLVSFEIDIQPIYSSARVSSTRSFSTSSVLATGEWYKIAILQTGIFKIDYLFLKSIGIDVEGIDPKNLRIYGNGGGILPLGNSQFRHDDLQENTILVSGENDGHFDKRDIEVLLPWPDKEIAARVAKWCTRIERRIGHRANRR